jgi:hypothetical protein
MVKRVVGIIMAAGALGGCVSMLTHVRYSDAETTQNATRMALVMACVDRGLLPGEVAYSYGYAFSQLLSVSVYDKDLYEKTFQKVRTDAASDEHSESASRGCRTASEALPQVTANVMQRYNEIRAARGIDLSSMSAQAASIGRPLPSTTPNYGPMYGMMPSSQVNFGMPAKQPNHYLVETGQGQRLCTATASGYVYCN